MWLLLLSHSAVCLVHSRYPISGAFTAIPPDTGPGTHMVCSMGTVAALYLRPTVCQVGAALGGERSVLGQPSRPPSPPTHLTFG